MIAIIQTAFLGDLLLTIPLLKNIKATWPEKKIILVCKNGLGDFFKSVQLVDEVIEVQKGQRASYKIALQKLRSFQIEFIFSPHQSLRTAWLCSRISALHKIGFRSWWNETFYSSRIPYQKKYPDALRQLSLLIPFSPQIETKIASYVTSTLPSQPNQEGRLPAPPDWARMSLEELGDEHFQEAYYKMLGRLSITLDNLKKAVFLFPGSVWATKRWTEQGYQEMGRALAEMGYEIFIMGGPGEEELCSRISREIPGARNFAGQTSILESFLLLRKGRLVIGNDSASSHLASCAAIPTIAIFGPTVLSFGFRPWSEQVAIVEEKNLGCRPCGKHGHRVCPIKTHECMKHIAVSQVLETAMRFLKSRD